MRVGNFVLGLTIGLCVGAVGGFFAAPAPQPASVASAPAVRPLAQHALVLTARPRKVARQEFGTPLQVAQVQVLEGKTPSVLLINSVGKIVYSSGPLHPAARIATASASGSANASQPAPVAVASAFVR